MWIIQWLGKRGEIEYPRTSDPLGSRTQSAVRATIELTELTQSPGIQRGGWYVEMMCCATFVSDRKLKESKSVQRLPQRESSAAARGEHACTEGSESSGKGQSIYAGGGRAA